MTPEQTFEALLATEEGKKLFAKMAIEQGFKDSEPSDYDFFIDNLYKKLGSIFVELEQKRDKYFSLDEDTITGIIQGYLGEAGYDATEQTKQNGAVDLTVRMGNHKWIAEAKIAYSNSKTLEGLLQLLTRYVTRDPKAGLLIYVKKSGFNDVFDDWKHFISTKKLCGKYIGKKANHVLEDAKTVMSNVKTSDVINRTLVSEHKLVCGSPIEVKHFAADLYFNPADASGNDGQKQKISTARNSLVHQYFEYVETGTFDAERCRELLADFFCAEDPDDIVDSD